eukprot:3371020-Rhodomonas_salina.1
MGQIQVGPHDLLSSLAVTALNLLPRPGTGAGTGKAAWQGIGEPGLRRRREGVVRPTVASQPSQA